MGEASFEGTWAIVSEGATKYIGRVVSFQDKDTPDGEFEWSSLDALRHATRFVLEPAFELVTPIVPGPGGFSRMPTILPVGATTDPVPVSVANGAVYFLEELSETDQAAYKDMVKTCQKQCVAARAKRSGLVMPKGDERA
jgi:hypothetical protein